MTSRRIDARYVRLCASLVLATGLCGAAVEDGSVAADRDAVPAEAPDNRTMVITSDSGAYCRTLSKAIEAHGALPREVRELKAQGEGMCDAGEVRGGISRLRRALLVLAHDN